MRGLVKRVPWWALFQAFLVAINVVVALLFGGSWANWAAAAFCAAMAALCLHFHMDSRKATKAVADQPKWTVGGYTGPSHLQTDALNKALQAALSSYPTSTPTTPARPAKKQPEPFHGVPFEFAVGEVYGLRMWHMDHYGRLRARNWEGAPPWRPGVNVAKCVQRKYDDIAVGHYSFAGSSFKWTVRDNPGHDVPSEQCSCGFYAYTDSLHAEVKSHAKDGVEPVLGIIEGTGKTLIGTQGFRCEKAEIVAFRDPTRGGSKTDPWRTRQLGHLRRVYPDVPILNDRASLLEFAPLTNTMPDPASDEFWALP